MAKCPYRFPARSRAAMIAAMESIGGYGGWNAPRRRSYAFAWNVKIDVGGRDYQAETLNPFHYDGGAFDASADSDFDSHLEESDSAFWQIAEDMRRTIDESEWSDYDGRTDFGFKFAGRSGGWLVLTSAHGRSMDGIDFDEMREDKDEWPFADVRALYRSLMVMDSDFSRKAVRAEWLHNLAFYRQQWEEERERKREAGARAIMAEAFKGEMGI